VTIAEESAPETEVDEHGHERWRYGEKVPTSGRGPLIEHADALDWLAVREPDSATAVVVDPPYSRHSPMRGREDGAAGSVSAPFSFMHRTMGLCARAVQPKGIVIVFGDWKLLPDLEYLCSVTGLREQQHLAWIRSRPGGGGLFRGACDPVLIASRTPPDRVDKAALKNWFLADYEIPRAHPYSKPPALIEYILGRACRPGDLVLDPFAGSGSSRVAARKLGLEWRGADIDPKYTETGRSAA
jgi:adenine-specific DNA-methyltransferase